MLKEFFEYRSYYYDNPHSTHTQTSIKYSDKKMYIFSTLPLTFGRLILVCDKGFWTFTLIFFFSKENFDFEMKWIFFLFTLFNQFIHFLFSKDLLYKSCVCMCADVVQKTIIIISLCFCGFCIFCHLKKIVFFHCLFVISDDVNLFLVFYCWK